MARWRIVTLNALLPVKYRIAKAYSCGVLYMKSNLPWAFHREVGL